MENSNQIGTGPPAPAKSKSKLNVNIKLDLKKGLLNPSQIKQKGQDQNLSPRHQNPSGVLNSARGGSPQIIANSPRNCGSPRQAGGRQSPRQTFGITPKSSARSSQTTKRIQMTILDAFKDEILDSCQQSPFGKLIYCDMQRMVDALSLVINISSVPLHVLFKFQRMEDGVSKSIIQQHQKQVKEINDNLPPEYQKQLKKNNRRGTLVEKKLSSKLKVVPGYDGIGLAEEIDMPSAHNPNQAVILNMARGSSVVQPNQFHKIGQNSGTSANATKKAEVPAKKKAARSCLTKAIANMLPQLQALDLQKQSEEINDELMSYLEKTFQIVWLYYSIGIFGRSTAGAQSIVSNLKNSKSKSQATQIAQKMRHRIKVCTFLLYQMAPEDMMNERIKQLKDIEILQLKVSLLDTVTRSSFVVSTQHSSQPHHTSLNVNMSPIKSPQKSGNSTTKNNRNEGTHHNLQGFGSSFSAIGGGVANASKANRSSMGLDQFIGENMCINPKYVEQTGGQSALGFTAAFGGPKTKYDLFPSIKAEISGYQNMNSTQVSSAIRKNFIKLLQSNLILAGCQMSQSKQVQLILNKYFTGQKSSLSIDLLIEAMEMHYEGFGSDSTEIFKQGLHDLASETTQEFHHDEIMKLERKNQTSLGLQPTNDANKGGNSPQTNAILSLTRSNEDAKQNLVPSLQFKKVKGHQQLASLGSSSHRNSQTHLGPSYDYLNLDKANNSRRENKSRALDSSRSNSARSRRSIKNVHNNQGGVQSRSNLQNHHNDQQDAMNNNHSAMRDSNLGLFNQQNQSALMQSSTSAENINVRGTGMQGSIPDSESFRQHTGGHFEGQIFVNEQDVDATQQITNQLQLDNLPQKDQLPSFGRNQNISKWISKNNSAYVQIVNGQIPENLANKPVVDEFSEISNSREYQATSNGGVEIFTSHQNSNSSLQTSIDSFEINVIEEQKRRANLEDGTKQIDFLENRQTIQLQNFIMLTDVISVPQLLNFFTSAQLSRQEMELQLLNQIDQYEDTLIERNMHQLGQKDLSLIFPYNGATVLYVILVLSIFGIKELKFAKSTEGIKICKVKLNANGLKQEDLIAIVNKIESVFLLAQIDSSTSADFQDHRFNELISNGSSIVTNANPKLAAQLNDQSFQDEFIQKQTAGKAFMHEVILKNQIEIEEEDVSLEDSLGSSFEKSPKILATDKNIQKDQNQLNLKQFSSKDRVKAELLCHLAEVNQRTFSIPKKPYEKMKILKIQNVLSRDYHFGKWQLIEYLDFQQREIATFGLLKEFADLTNVMREQRIEKALRQRIHPKYVVAITDLIQASNTCLVDRKQTDITEDLIELIEAELPKDENEQKSSRDRMNTLQSQETNKLNTQSPYKASVNMNTQSSHNNQRNMPLDLNSEKESYNKDENQSPNISPSRKKNHGKDLLLKTKPAVVQLQKLVDAITLSQIQASSIDFKNALLLKIQKKILEYRIVTGDTPSNDSGFHMFRQDPVNIESGQGAPAEQGQQQSTIPSNNQQPSTLNVLVTNPPLRPKVQHRMTSISLTGAADQDFASFAGSTIDEDPLQIQLTDEARAVELVCQSAKLESKQVEKANQSFVFQKQKLIVDLQAIEALLLCIDQRMYHERLNLINMLKYVAGGIETRENSIKEQLANIASLEMEKGMDEDQLSEQTLKTIEIVNIGHISSEQQILDRAIGALEAKMRDLEGQELQIMKEKKKRDDRRAAKKQAAANEAKAQNK